MKTNGARFLESLGIPFELREYEVDPEDLSAITVAKKIGMPPEQVFKTLLVTGGPNIYRFAVVPGNAELDFKKLARACRSAQSRDGPAERCAAAYRIHSRRRDAIRLKKGLPGLHR